MAFSYNSYTGDGSTEFSISFNYLTDTVVVSSDPKGIEVHLDGIKQTSGYTVNTSTHKVNFTVGPTTGVDIKILRVTPRAAADRLVDFADATIITETQLDTMALQLLYISQEAFEQSSSGGSVTPTYLSYDEANGYWDATYNAAARTIRNLSTPQSDDAASSKKYVDDVATWGISGVPQSWAFSGTGAQDTFTLSGAPYVEKEMLVVAIDGVLQVPASDFTVEGAAVDSTLDFDVAPGNGTAISVQNFGKMRFLDGVNISDGSITTVKLDQVASTQAVSTATIRDDAVTAAKIADGVVDFARVDTTTFTASSEDTTPRFLSVPIDGTGLTLGTLSSSQVSDFNEQVQSTKLNELAAPTASVSMNSQTLTNLADPTADQDGATRKYVSDTIAAEGSVSGLVKLGSYSLGSNASTFAIEDWYDAAYDGYEFECYNFHSSSSGPYVAIGLLFADSGGTYRNTSSDYSLYWEVGGSEPSTSANTTSKNGCAVPMANGSSSTDIHKANFKLWLPNNRAGFSDNKRVIARGDSAFVRTYSSALPGNSASTSLSTYGSYFISNTFTFSTTVITKIKFRCINDEDSTGTAGNIRAGARVIVYGRKF